MAERSTCDPKERLISATAAARKLGVDVATLVRWHSRNCGPAATSWSSGAGLAYRCSDLEAWQDHVGATHMSEPVGSSRRGHA